MLWNAFWLVLDKIDSPMARPSSRWWRRWCNLKTATALCISWEWWHAFHVTTLFSNVKCFGSAKIQFGIYCYIKKNCGSRRCMLKMFFLKRRQKICLIHSLSRRELPR
jgi:hypothetical protein